MTGIFATPHQRIRAKQACTSCNTRRIRCNVTQVKPCFNCQAAGFSCETVPSRRGRRKQRNIQKHELPKKTEQRRDPALVHTDTVNSTLGGDTERTKTPTARPIASPVTGESTSPDLFFGESNALTCVSATQTESPIAENDNRGRKAPFYYPILSSLGTFPPQDENIRALKTQILQLQGVFNQEDLARYDPVFQAYFTWFYPCFPVVDKAEFATQYLENRIPLILLNAVLFAGITYCSEDTVRSLGYQDLAAAKYEFYNKTKAIFEADWETNNAVILQAIFHLTFLRVPMSSPKGHRYWMSVGINLAQAHGLHRSSSLSAASPRQAKLDRRLWWSLYVRDRHTSASLGLPSRIRDKDCDVELLSSTDLLDEELPPVSWLPGPLTEEQRAYATNMPPLMTILGQVVTRFYAPNRTSNDEAGRAEMTAKLEHWRNNLPFHMQQPCSDDGTCNMWICVLHLAYNHVLILLHRGDFLVQRGKGAIAAQAANRVSRITEELLSFKLVRFGQLYLITSLFAALCIHTLDMQRSESIAQRLAESRARLCLLGLKEIQKTWEINNDILDLFFHLIESRVADQLQHNLVEEGTDKTSTAPGVPPHGNKPTEDVESQATESSNPEPLTSTSRIMDSENQTGTLTGADSNLQQFPFSPIGVDPIDDFSFIFTELDYFGDGMADGDFEALQRCL